MQSSIIRQSEDENRKLLLALIAAEDEEKVDAILRSDAYANSLGWWPFDGREENFAIINNQQTDPVAALTEKPINSIDSVLLQECRLAGIDPESSAAPKSMNEAVEKFFGIRSGDLSTVTEAHRRQLARRIRIVAEGGKERPNIVVADFGEGQNPDDFKDTLLSLNRKNKTRVPFVQGKYGMGGTGVIPFCGDRKYELVLSRRNPALLKPGQKDLWGFTLVRKTPEEKLGPMDKHSWFECLVDAEMNILTFRAERLEILPDDKALTHGCYIKLFNYEIPSPSFVTTDLWRDLNRRLYSPALPILIEENRSKHFKITKGKNDSKVLVGNKFRILKDDRDMVNEAFDIEADLGPFGRRDVGVVVFRDFDKDGKDLRRKGEWTTRQECVFLTVNGQTHNTINHYWLEENTGLESLTDYMLVHLDSTTVNRSVADDIFLGSRDRVRDNKNYREFLAKLAAVLGKNEVLLKLNEEYRQRQLERIVPDKSIAKEVISGLVSRNEALLEYFNPGKEISIREIGEKTDIPDQYMGNYIPTYLRPLKEFDGPLLVKVLPINSPHTNLLLGTDAQNDYLKREKDKGRFEWTSSDERAKVSSRYLFNGMLFLHLSVEESTEGEIFDFAVRLTRPDREPLEVIFKLQVTKPKERRESTQPPAKKGIKLPELVAVRKEPGPNNETWADHEWGPEDVAKVKDGIAVYVNLDSDDLQTYITTCPKGLRGLAETLYKVGIYLNAIIYDMELDRLALPVGKEEVFEAIIKGLSKTLLPVYLDKRLQELAVP